MARATLARRVNAGIASYHLKPGTALLTVHDASRLHPGSYRREGHGCAEFPELLTERPHFLHYFRWFVDSNREDRQAPRLLLLLLLRHLEPSIRIERVGVPSSSPQPVALEYVVSSSAKW